MPRWRDADKSLARGSAPGTRGGKAISYQSRPASREPGGNDRSPLQPPADALLVVRRHLRPLRYFLVWTLYAAPLALAYGAAFHRVAWWLLAIPLLRVFNLLVVQPRPWLALTSGELLGRETSSAWSIERAPIESIQVDRGESRRIEFANASGRSLADAPLLFTDRQIGSVADALGVRVVDHRAH